MSLIISLISQIAMEYCVLGSLRDVFCVLEKPFKEEQIRVVCRNVLKGLEYLHSRSKIHRDIKTDNILVNAEGQPKLGMQQSGTSDSYS